MLHSGGTLVTKTHAASGSAALLSKVRPPSLGLANELTAYLPVLQAEIQHLELAFMKRFYPEVDELITSSQGLADRDWTECSIPFDRVNEALVSNFDGGSLARAVAAAANYCGTYSQHLTHWGGWEYYMTPPADLSTQVGASCQFLYGIGASHRNVCYETQEFGLFVDNRELSVAIEWDEDEAAIPFHIRLIRDDSMPPSWTLGVNDPTAFKIVPVIRF
jgi:hypothetical protein